MEPFRHHHRILSVVHSKLHRRNFKQIVRLAAVNICQSHFTLVRVLGMFSHTTCCPLRFAFQARFSDRSINQGKPNVIYVKDFMSILSVKENDFQKGWERKADYFILFQEVLQ